MRVRILLTLALFAAPTSAMAQTAPLSPRDIIRADAPKAGPGDVARVAGRVSLGPGIIDTGSISIYIQDATGAGLHVVGRASAATEALAAGDSVDVVGTVGLGHTGLELSDAVISRFLTPRVSPTAYSV
ncbi:MAG TPA: hypothetical protein VHV78_04685, partial [Gemmatimonadaceae bacterium]|nr:hypothetical protein [Gemmatimonadaceae bacterium]